MFEFLKRFLFHSWYNIDRHPWRAIRFQGGGTILSPRDMTEQEAVDWVSNSMGEVAFIDRECGFIFYRARNQ
jgi:hypothetical protein